jgi:hypothetical protein
MIILKWIRREVGYGGMEMIDVAEDKDRWPRACECSDENWACINCGGFFGQAEELISLVLINILKTERNLLYIRNQSSPHCKHFSPRL